MSTHGLTFGALDLTGSTVDANGVTFAAVANGHSWGAPDAEVSVVRTLISDGDLVEWDRDGNRIVTMTIRITGPDPANLAKGEASLAREMRKSNTITWTPPEGWGPATVFVVLTSYMEHDMKDMDELKFRREYRVTLTCLPYARSENLTVFTALGVGTGSALIDDCTSATGWTGWRGKTAQTPSTLWEAGSVGIVDLDAAITSPESWRLTTPTISVDFTTMPYLVVEARTVSPVNDLVGVVQHHSGTVEAHNAISMRALAEPGWFEYIYELTPAVTTALTFSHTSAPGEAWQGLLIRNISHRGAPPGRPREQSRMLEVGGTERGPASLRIGSADGIEHLGLAIVHVSPEDGSGYSPDLRRWRTSGNTVTTDAATYSGAREVLGPNFVQCDIPITSLPADGYQLMMLARSTSAGSHDMEATIQSRQDGITLGETTWDGTVTFPVANEWKLLDIDLFNIPIVAAKSGEFRIAFRTPSTTDVEFDQAWVFKMGDDCGLWTGTISAPNMWLDSADVTSRVPRVWQGNSADKSDARFPQAMQSNMRLTIAPPRVRVHTATHNTDRPNVELTAYKWWHTHAAED